MENFDATIYAQYVNSNRLYGLIDTFNQAVSPENWIDSFYDLIWNINTATTYGLNVWGKIVVVDRLLTVTEQQIYFGFNEATSDPHVIDDPQPFNQAPFYSGTHSTSTISLSDDAYRKLIMMKAMSNITNCTIPSMNKILMYMFGNSGRCYVRNDGGMVMSYVFEFELTPVELAIAQSSGALPSPAGVTVQIIQQV